MLTSYIISVYVIWILSLIAKGVSLYSILLLIPTSMFAVRKVGIHIKAGKIAVCEGLFLFFSISLSAIFGKLNIIRVLITVVLRIIFLIICFYEDTVYVYIQEERKR